MMRHFFLEDLDSAFARMDPSGNIAWYLTDHLGSVRGLMNDSNSLTDQITYDAAGNISSESSPTNGDRYKFAGGEYSSVTALLHFGARYYDPASGRWTSEDPIGFAGNDGNLYRYARNDTTNGVDLSGLTIAPYSPVGPSDVAAYEAAMQQAQMQQAAPAKPADQTQEYTAYAPGNSPLIGFIPPLLTPPAYAPGNPPSPVPVWYGLGDFVAPPPNLNGFTEPIYRGEGQVGWRNPNTGLKLTWDPSHGGHWDLQNPGKWKIRISRGGRLLNPNDKYRLGKLKSLGELPEGLWGLAGGSTTISIWGIILPAVTEWIKMQRYMNGDPNAPRP